MNIPGKPTPLSDHHREMAYVLATSGIFFLIAVMFGWTSSRNGGGWRILSGAGAIAALIIGFLELLKVWRGSQNSSAKPARLREYYSLIEQINRATVWAWYGFAIPGVLIGVGFKALIPAHPVMAGSAIATGFGVMLMASILLVSKRRIQTRKETA